MKLYDKTICSYKKNVLWDLNKIKYILIMLILDKVRAMVLNATFNNISAISWRSVLLVEETEVRRENRQPAVSP